MNVLSLCAETRRGSVGWLVGWLVGAGCLVKLHESGKLSCSIRIPLKRRVGGLVGFGWVWLVWLFGLVA